MFSNARCDSDSIINYDFEAEENGVKWKHLFVASLRQVQTRVHPSLTVKQDALSYVESLIFKLLSSLVASSPHTICDIEERVRHTFPDPLNKWAINKATETLATLKQHKKSSKLSSSSFTSVDKNNDKNQIKLPVEKIHQLLQKEVLGHKVDIQVTHFIVSILDYIAADIFQLTGHYVKNIRHSEITCQDIKVAMCADKVLMDMFYKDEDVSLTNTVSEDISDAKRRDSVTYDEVVKDLIHEEKQFIRDLNLIIKVFRDPLINVVSSCELKKIFFNIDEIYDFSITFLGSLEDALEVAEDSCPPAIGICFEEMAECGEFAGFENYADVVMTNSCRDRILQLLTSPKVAPILSTTGHGMILALKYVLPKLLIGPVYHCFSYFKYIEFFKDLTLSDEDKESFIQAEGLLTPLKYTLDRVCKRNSKSGDGYLRLYGRTNRAMALQKMAELQSKIDGWEGKDIGHFCNEFVMDGPLGKLSGTYSTRSGRLTERHVFLFDGLMILCKSNNKRSSMTVAVTGNPQCEWRLKEKYLIRNIEIIDREDYSSDSHHEINGSISNANVSKYAFEIAPRDQTHIILFAKSLEEKASWMSNLILLNTRSMLERTLDSMLCDEEKKHPLRLPSPDVYRFAVEDSDTNIIFEENKSNSNVPLIKGATLIKLVERLTYHMYADPMFVRTFLTTYRSFCTPQDLLDLLIERFEIPVPELNSTIGEYNNSNSGAIDTSTTIEDDFIRNNYREILKRFRKEYSQPVQFRVLNVLRHWIDHHYYDFERDHNLLEKLRRFLDERVRGKNMKKWCENIKKVLDRKAEATDGAFEPQIKHSFEKSPPPLEWHITRETDKFDLLTLHPIELARQLTLLEFDLYRAVKPSELVGTEGQSVVWTKKDKQKTSPNLLRMIHHTSNFTFWLEKCIVEAENIDERVAIMSRIIEIMIVLQDLNNFNGVLEVVSAMGSACVHRLEHTMGYIKCNSKLKRALDDAQELSVDHFKRYHEKLRSINPPCVPFFGMYLTNILHIEEGNPEFLVTPNTQSLASVNNHHNQCSYDSQSTLTSISSQMSCHTSSMLTVSASTPALVSITANSNNNAANITPNPTQRLINFTKRRKVAEITGEIQQYQNQPYCLTVQLDIRNFLESLNPLGDLDEKELNDYLYTKSLEIEPRGVKQLNKFPRRWPELNLKSPGIKPRGSRSHHLPTLQSLDSLRNSLSTSQIEETNLEMDCQMPSPSTPLTPPHSAASFGAGDHSVFAHVYIGGGGGGPSPTTPIHSTPPTPSPWSASSLQLNPTTPPPLPPRIRARNSSQELPSPRSRCAPTLMSTRDESSPPPLPPRSTTSTLPRNYSHSGSAHVLQRLNSDGLTRRNSALDLPLAPPLTPRRYSQSGLSGQQTQNISSPPQPPPSGFPVSVTGPQLPPKTYRQMLNNTAR